MPTAAQTSPVDSTPIARIDATTDPVVILPDGVTVFNVAVSRAGDDLLLTTADGRTISLTGFFTVPSPPDIADLNGGYLAGDLATISAELGGDIPVELLEAVFDMETAAGGARDEEGRFDVENLQVTLGFQSPGFNPFSVSEVQGPPSLAIDGAGENLFGLGHRDITTDTREFPEVQSSVALPLGDPPPIATAVRLDSSGFTRIPGLPVEGLLPTPVAFTGAFYDTRETLYEIRNLAGEIDREILATRPLRMLSMTVGSGRSTVDSNMQGVRPIEINEFLGRDPTAPFGEGVDPADGAVIRATVSVAPQEMLLIDLFFEPGTSAPGNDFAFVVVNGESFVVSDAETVSPGEEGWRTIAIRNEGVGVPQVGIGVLNDLNTSADPTALIDDIRVTRLRELGEVGDRIFVQGNLYDVISEQSGTADPRTDVTLLARPLIAFRDRIEVDRETIFDSGARSLLDNDQVSPYLVEDGEPPVTLTVTAINGDAMSVGQSIAVTTATGDPAGQVTVAGDGVWQYDPMGAFDDVARGETVVVRFDYTATTSTGDSDSATVIIRVEDEGGGSVDPNSLAPRTVTLDSSAWSSGPRQVWQALLPDADNRTADFYAVNEPDHLERDLFGGLERRFLPTEGDGMLVLAAGSIAPFGLEGGLEGSRSDEILAFIDVFDFPTGSAAIDGSVIKSNVFLNPGETLFAEVLFDPRAGESRNDFAFVVADGDMVSVADVDTTNGGFTGWQTIAIQNTTDGVSTFAFGVMNDTDAEVNPYLLIDNVRIDERVFDAPAGARVDVGGTTFQVLALDTGAESPNLEVRTLTPIPEVAGERMIVAESDRLDSVADPSVPGLLANDVAPAPTYVSLDGKDLPVPLTVTAVNGLSDAVSSAIPLERPSGERGGFLTVEADGSFTFETAGDFSDLAFSEREQISFDYTVSTPDGGTDTATATIEIRGDNTNRVLADFEGGALPGTEMGDVELVDGVSTEDFEAVPADGSQLAKLTSAGRFPHIISEFIELDHPGPLVDLVDNTGARRGSALTLSASLDAGDQVSFYWWFDNAEPVFGSAAGLNDFALILAGEDRFRFADGRMQYARTGEFAGELEGFWTQWTAPETGTFDLSWAVFDDTPKNVEATLLIDLVEVNAPIPDGYTSVPEMSSGAFETFAPPTSI